MVTLDFDYRFYAVVLCLACFLFFLFRHPAANCLLGFTAIGLGPEAIYGSVSYAQTCVILQSIAVIALCFRIIRHRKLDVLLTTIFRRWTLFLLGLGILWVKVLVDCAIYGVDEFRFGALRVSVYTVFLPSVILLLAIVSDGVERAVKGVIYGLCLFPCAYLLPLVYPMLVEGRIIEAVTGEARLTTFGQDPINGGRMFFFGSFGFIFAGALARERAEMRIAWFGLALAFFILMLLNGTRQFVFAIGVAFIAVFAVLGRIREVVGVSVLIGIAVVAYLVRGIYSEAQVAERVTAENLVFDVSQGRGQIWRNAFDSAMEAPITGVGFRNFGEQLSTISAETGEGSYSRSNAHGFFQEVFVEHGLILGMALFCAWLRLLWRFLSAKRKATLVVERFAFILFFVLTLPEFFSGAVFDCIGFHLFAVVGPSLAKRELPVKGGKPKPIERRSLVAGQALIPMN